MKALPEDLEGVGHVELRSRLPEVLGRLGEDRPALALTKRNRVEAVLLSPAVFERLAGAESERDRMQAALPVLLAAAGTGVAFPSETLCDLLGTDLEIDWKRMNAFQSTFPLATTHDEDGNLLPEPPDRLESVPIEELDDELRYR